LFWWSGSDFGDVGVWSENSSPNRIRRHPGISRTLFALLVLLALLALLALLGGPWSLLGLNVVH
jgi:hypothetical protein